MTEGRTGGIVQMRGTRPTDRLEAAVASYRDALGPPVLSQFRDNAGYDGVMIGVRGQGWHLEFAHRRAGSPCPVPSRDNLIVPYIPGEADFARTRARIETRGHAPVEPENPYWRDKALTYDVPDGWRVVPCRTAGS